MKLYVIRHAQRQPSDDFAESKEGDPEAELTPEGELAATALGEWMADNDEIPSIVYASDSVRTQQTAELLAKAIGEAGYAAPEIKTDVSIGSFMSIRGLVLKLGAEGARRAAIVSHHESIDSGLHALNVDNNDPEKPDPHAMGELRILRVKRATGRWREEKRVRPSDLGLDDSY